LGRGPRAGVAESAFRRTIANSSAENVASSNIGQPNCPVASNSGWRSRGALATRPRLVLADEPTGQPDSQTGQQVVALPRDLVERSSSKVLVATQHPALTSFADRVLHLCDGRLEATQ
jgi:ABC-type ATPase involved in cell division